VRVPNNDVSSLISDNLILLRYVESKSRHRRLISVLKVRDSDFDPSFHEYVTTAEGLMIEEVFDLSGADMPRTSDRQAGASADGGLSSAGGG